MFYVLHSSSIIIQLTIRIPVISMYLQAERKTNEPWHVISNNVVFWQV